MTESIKMIEFGPEGPRLVEVNLPPVLAVESDEPKGPSNWEIVGYFAASFLLTGTFIYLLIWWVGTW